MAKELDEAFVKLRSIYRRCERRCVVLADSPGKSYLGTHHVGEKDGYRTWFGGVARVGARQADPEASAAPPGAACFTMSKSAEANRHPVDWPSGHRWRAPRQPGNG